MGLSQLRAAVPAKYPIRRYPDITHSRHSQYPVPDWDLAYASTEGREVINPRPMQQAHVRHLIVLEKSALAGIVSFRDLLAADLDEKEEAITLLNAYVHYIPVDLQSKVKS